jgi:hypothetical protein
MIPLGRLPAVREMLQPVPGSSSEVSYRPRRVAFKTDSAAVPPSIGKR